MGNVDTSDEHYEYHDNDSFSVWFIRSFIGAVVSLRYVHLCCDPHIRLLSMQVYRCRPLSLPTCLLISLSLMQFSNAVFIDFSFGNTK